MPRAQIIRYSLFALGIGAALALFIWRVSIDWAHITPRALGDAAQDALFLALLVSLGSVPSSAEGAQAQSDPIRTLSLILATALGGIILFNGYLASQRLACRDRALSEAAAAGTSASMAIANCFEAGTVE